MPENPSIGERYREAWIRLVGDDWKSESSDNRGIELLSHPTGRRISEILTGRGQTLIEEHPGTSGVALSLRYRDGTILATQPCLTFFVSESKFLESIPPEIDGVPTDVVVAGTQVLRQGRHGPHVPGSPVSPLQPGCSVAHKNVTTGTFGCLVEDEHSRTTYILSCAHILSDGASKGNEVIHPGSSHGGSVSKGHIADFTTAIPLSSGICVADAAIAKVIPSSTVITASIRYIGVPPSGKVTLSCVGDGVKKSGDQTGLTHGIVTGIKATVGPYDVHGVTGIYFDNVIVTSAMSESGDSGSVLLTNANEAVGLLFGGLEHPDSTGSMVPVVSWYSPIEPVLTHLGVKLK